MPEKRTDVGCWRLPTSVGFLFGPAWQALGAPQSAWNGLASALMRPEGSS